MRKEKPLPKVTFNKVKIGEFFYDINRNEDSKPTKWRVLKYEKITKTSAMCVCQEGVYEWEDELGRIKTFERFYLVSLQNIEHGTERRDNTAA